MAKSSLTGTGALSRALAGIEQKLVARAGNPELKVGFLRGATYPNGTSVALVAAINEFGAPSRGQPPRPFFRNMIAQYGPAWSGQTMSLLRQNDYDISVTLKLMGELISGQLRQSINDLRDPPLAPSTIKRKGFDKPLIDTSVMVNSISYEVVDEP